MCQLPGCLFFTRLSGCCCPAVRSVLSRGRGISCRGRCRGSLEVCSPTRVFLCSLGPRSILQRDRGFGSVAAWEVFVRALCCSEDFKGAPSAWPTRKYGYRRAWCTNNTNPRKSYISRYIFLVNVQAQDGDFESKLC